MRRFARFAPRRFSPCPGPGPALLLLSGGQTQTQPPVGSPTCPKPLVHQKQAGLDLLTCTRLLFGTATNDLTGGARRGKGAMVISDTLALSSRGTGRVGGPPAPPLLPQSCLRRLRLRWGPAVCTERGSVAARPAPRRRRRVLARHRAHPSPSSPLPSVCIAAAAFARALAWRRFFIWPGLGVRRFAAPPLGASVSPSSPACSSGGSK